ncbi:inorganic polyphosphate/ATP-NAD kinase [Clostridia bacterium]|nr:inorganic polyphosphate/ATP-NAD kinase [Clostridia bacterium]
MKVGILANVYREPRLQAAREIIKAFVETGADISVDLPISKAFPGFPYFERTDVSTVPDLLVTVGGDGTILSVISEAARKKIPILGINFGTVGFLAELEQGEFPPYIDRIAKGDYRIEERTMLELTVNGARPGHLALNEFLISRGPVARMIHVDVYADGNLLDTYRADGFMVSTPTGSTAYALAAGGPLMEPSIKAFSLVPVSAHSLHSRPIIVGDGETVTVRLKDDKAPTVIVADGEIMREVSSKDEIHIRKAKEKALFIRLKPQNFYEKLKTKLEKWS